MRPSCVLLLLVAFAVPPVGVAAHAELSDNVATDGRHEVQRHLRIRAHDADDDERTGPQVGELMSANVLKDAASSLKIPIAGTSRNGALDNEILNLKNPDLLAKASKKRKRSAEQIANYPLKVAAEAIQAYEEMNKGKNSQTFPDMFAKLNERPNRRKMFAAANQILLEKGYTPEKAFEIYGLHLPRNELFSKNRLFHWANFLNAYNGKNKMDISMLTILVKYYSLETLVDEASKYSRTKNSMEVVSLIMNHYKKEEVHPAALASSLELDKSKQNGPRSVFWKHYATFYSKKKNEER